MAATAHSASQPVAGEDDLVRLDPDHPGFRDAVYRARRNQIARIALAYKPGEPVPRIEYTEEEHAVWRAVWEKLAPVHARHACRAYREAHARLALDPTRIPQLADVNPQLKARTGFQMVPVAGLVTSRVFLGQLGQGTFLSTQYIRHASRPLYTPEPDVVHELVGHAAACAIPSWRPEPAVRQRPPRQRRATSPCSSASTGTRWSSGWSTQDGEPAPTGRACCPRSASWGGSRPRRSQAVRPRRGGGAPLRSHRLPGGAVRGPRPRRRCGRTLARLARRGQAKVGAR